MEFLRSVNPGPNYWGWPDSTISSRIFPDLKDRRFIDLQNNIYVAGIVKSVS